MTAELLLHYRVLEAVGQGGMGVVYKALDTRLDRPVALKVLSLQNDPVRRRQFMWEARAAAALRHPNIVVIHDIASDQGIDFIVMEYIPGRTLAEHLAAGPLPRERILRYGIEIASALEAAHAAGIVHRDLKPSNVLVTPEGFVKLVDFGLARLRGDTSSRTVAGTRPYMSPEQARGEGATSQSDIFSFGAVLYEMCTGRPPFTGGTAACRPPALERLVRRCLQRDPRRRMQHMGDVRLALEEIAPGEARRIAISRRGALLAGGLLAGGALAGWFLAREDAPPESFPVPVPLGSFPGRSHAASWAPGGRQAAFAWNGGDGGHENIYLLQPGSSQTLRVTAGPGRDASPAWSPDGRWIAYIHSTADRHFLNLVSPLGGAPRTVLAGDAPFGQPCWAPDGQVLVFESAIRSGAPRSIAALWIDSGRRRLLTTPPEGIPGDLTPAVAPDGSALAFCRKTAWRTAELYLLALRPGLVPDGSPRRLTSLGYVSSPAWTPDGARIVFQAQREHVGLWQLNRSGHHLRPVPGAPASATEPAVAARPDGHWSLIFTDSYVTRNIWRYSTGRGPDGPPQELVPSHRCQDYPRYSHDGTRLAFSSTRTGYEEVWVAHADGSQPVQVTDLRHQLTEVQHWSPDDSVIVFVSQDRGRRQLYQVRASGGPALPLTGKNDDVEIGTGWTRDGSAYYYNRVRLSKFEIWKVPRGGGRSARVVSDGVSGFESAEGIFHYWRLRGDGAAILYRRTRSGDVQLPVSPPANARRPVVVAPGGFYYQTLDAANGVYWYDEASGRSVRVVEDPGRSFGRFTVSPDGRWLAVDSLGPETVELMMLENFL